MDFRAGERVRADRLVPDAVLRLIVTGWILATTVVAGVTRTAGRQ